ncbi:hypothetical protein [Umboniibacter marinipuniceus]|uniref:NADH:flavin oxidoreductase/NADH oxidase family protein n=1 Tax=Umboniibacter marinipuniceus TaxID=569599 RepID=A0A3M0A543_9GAMM|nr:hypothetical protein [Umboniibacter marinipuniceus]RMA80291.1 NADH:flavin oxidoreductase/NADH oxidase family protein [Umboniibacter marinipuniceus]
MSFATTSLSSSLSLSAANDVKNRFVKGACQEGLANALNDPTPQLESLYRRWSMGGAGVIISGTTWVIRGDEIPRGDLVLDQLSDVVAFRRLAKAGQVNNSHCWLQLSHFSSRLDPSFNELDASEVMVIIQSFVEAAQRAENAGFSGVQIAAHHGHFLGDSLNAATNQRDDMWGGDSGRRASLLFAIIAEIRKAVRADFLVSLTLDTSALESDDGEPAQQLISLLDQKLDTLQLIGELPKNSLIEGFSSAALVGSGEALNCEPDQHSRENAPFKLISFDWRYALLPNLVERWLATSQLEWPKSWPRDEASSASTNAKLSHWYQDQMYLLSMGEKSVPVAGALSLRLRVALVRWRSERSQRRLFSHH